MFEAIAIESVVRKYKVVNYFGVDLFVPDTAGVLTTDSDGSVYWNPPDFSPRPYLATWTFLHTGYIKIGVIAFSGDWKESLMEIPGC